MVMNGVNFGAVTGNSVPVKNDKSGLKVRTVATAAAVPVAVGLGYAGRFYYENKGKASVYKEFTEKFPAEDAYKSCLKLTEKSMRNAKIAGVGLVVAGAATVLGYAGAKFFGVIDKVKAAKAQKQAAKAAAKKQQKTQPQEEKASVKEKQDVVKAEKAPEQA